MGHYSVEIRACSMDGDYSENHYEFNTPEEVNEYIEKDLGYDEYIHSVLFYEDGQTSNPRDVTKQFPKNRPLKRK